jgi:hypothetical protein
MTEVFVSKSAEVRMRLLMRLLLILSQLKDCLLEQIAASPQPGRAKIEISSWLSRATLDIIGLAGFNYSFDALKFGEDSNELGSAFAQIFDSAASANFFNLLQGQVPILQWIVRLLSHLRLSTYWWLSTHSVPFRINLGSTIPGDLQGPANHEENWSGTCA